MSNTAVATSLAKLTEYNFILVTDASGSMGETDMPGGRSRWVYMQETAMAFARDLAALDSDGIDVITFGGASVITQVGVKADAVANIFTSRRPMGGTPLAEALRAAFEQAGKSDKKAFIMVFTDGVPDDKAAAAQAIIEQSHRQDTDDELTVLFIQVGRDAGASAYLRELDDALVGAKFDIVDAKTQEEAEQFPSTAELILHAIND